MSFVSGYFIILVVLLFIVYFFLGERNSRYQWLTVLIASLVYYVTAVGWQSLILLTYILISWLCGIGIQNRERVLESRIAALQTGEEKQKKKELRSKTEKEKKIILFSALFIQLGILVFLKCGMQFVSPGATGLRWLVMPLGISFFTFFNVGYCIDVYRESVPAETNLLKYALYICYFPHIGQGPIDRFELLAPQLTENHRFKPECLRMGLERVLIGYFKKLVIANKLSLFIDPVFADPGMYSGFVAAFATLVYAFQIYADFSGYMDIACGISQCLGIKLSENFQTPYLSKSIAEYWRRWHITLGAWFRDYLYYPVLRSRAISEFSKNLRRSGHKKLAKNCSTTVGLLVTWFLIGFWHGSSWHFIVHGLYNGSIIILSTLLSDLYATCCSKLHISEEKPAWKLFQIIRTFVLVSIGNVFFRAESLTAALMIFRRILTAFIYDGWSVGLLSESLDLFYWGCMFAGILVMVLMDLIETKEIFLNWINRQKLPVRWCILYIFMLPVLFVIIFSNVRAAGAGNFIYYNF